jgi:hypothetical protein
MDYEGFLIHGLYDSQKVLNVKIQLKTLKRALELKSSTLANIVLGEVKIPTAEIRLLGQPLWSCGQSSWLQIQMSRVRFLALPDFLRSNGFRTGSTQPREGN